MTEPIEYLNEADPLHRFVASHIFQNRKCQQHGRAYIGQHYQMPVRFEAVNCLYCGHHFDVPKDQEMGHGLFLGHMKIEKDAFCLIFHTHSEVICPKCFRAQQFSRHMCEDPGFIDLYYSFTHEEQKNLKGVG